MTKLTKMKGASLLPKKVADLAINIGYNSAVTQLEQCSVEVDEIELKELLAKFNIEFNGKSPNYQWLNHMAKELSKCKQKWLRLGICPAGKKR